MFLKRLWRLQKNVPPEKTPTSSPCPYQYGERLGFAKPGGVEKWVAANYDVWLTPEELFIELMMKVPDEWTKADDEPTLPD